MNYSIKTTPIFDKDVKKLAKKYTSLKKDLLKLRDLLLIDPKAGFALGNSCFKIRLAIESKNKGKSGGARVISNVVSVDESTGTVYLLTVYDKAEQENIADKELKQLLLQIK